MNTHKKMELLYRKRINVHEAHEMLYWRKTFNISAGELREAIGRVGTSTDLLWAFLKG